MRSSLRQISMKPLTGKCALAACVWLTAPTLISGLRRGRWWSRIILVLLLAPVFAATWLARQNHFEWMFNPLPNPAYAQATEASSFVKSDDRVLAVTMGGESVAYPIRIMAYHHLVQDTVGGTPIVATY